MEVLDPDRGEVSEVWKGRELGRGLGKGEAWSHKPGPGSPSQPNTGL